MNHHEDIEALFGLLDNNKSENDLIQEDAYILQANYLSEIERLYKDKGLNRKELAEKIKTSPSYLTQVFRGDKPLNFLTLAKIKRALNLQFEVRASLKTTERKVVFEDKSIKSDLISTDTFFTGTFTSKNFYENFDDVSGKSGNFTLKVA